MVMPPAGLLIDCFGPPSKSHPGNASPAQTRSTFSASPEPNDDDLDEAEDDEDYVPGRALRRKRRRPNRSNTFGRASKSTKRRPTSENPKLSSAGSSTIVGEKEDSADIPMVPNSINKSWRSTNVARQTVSASEAYCDSRGVKPSPSDTSPLGSLGGSALDPEDLIQRENDHARMSLREDTTHYAHGTLHPSSTLDPGASRNVDDQQTHACDGTELGNSDRSQMRLSPSWPFSTPARAREDPLEPAARSGVPTFVISSGGDIQHWPSAKLNKKKLNTIFDEVSAMTSTNEIQKIMFSLRTGKVKDDLSYTIKRGDEAAFEAVMEEFKSRMSYLKACRKKGEARFKIHLTLDPKQQSAEKEEVAQDTESDGESF